MIFALSFLFVFAVLYILIYDSSSSNLKHTDFDDLIKSRNINVNLDKPSVLNFDFETLINPDELSILISKD